MRATSAAHRDPRYVDASEASNKSNDAEIDAAWELVTEPPATIAGAAALITYVLDYKISDLTWPEVEVGNLDDFASALLVVVGECLDSVLSAGAVS
jgi:hypothetical protein